MTSELTPCEVLLVEDSPSDAELLQASLDNGDAEIAVSWVQSLPEAERWLSQHDPDAILLDLGLGPTQGLSTLEAFQAFEADLPVVVLSGLDDDAVAKQAIEAGAQDYLVKGVGGSSNEIARAVRYAIARKEEHAAREAARDAMHELALARKEAEFKSEFLNMAAHELATPLTPLKFQCARLRRAISEADLSQAEETVEVFSRNVTSIARLIDDLLNSARLQSEAVTLAKDPIDLHDAVQRAMDSYAPVAKDAGIDLKLEAGHAPTVEGDGGRIEQILTNLIDNGIKFTPSGGQVTVRIGTECGDAVVAISDTGPGIGLDEVDAVFEPFSRAHDPDRIGLGPKGTGLGLYIARGLARAMEGDLVAQSPETDEGATFVLRLPRAGRSSDNGHR